MISDRPSSSEGSGSDLYTELYGPARDSWNRDVLGLGAVGGVFTDGSDSDSQLAGAAASKLTKPQRKPKAKAKDRKVSGLSIDDSGSGALKSPLSVPVTDIDSSIKKLQDKILMSNQSLKLVQLEKELKVTEKKLRSARSRVDLADSGAKPAKPKVIVAERDPRAHKSRSRNVVKMKLAEDKDVRGFADLRERADDVLDHMLGRPARRPNQAKPGASLVTEVGWLPSNTKLGFVVLVPFPVMAAF